MVLNKTRESLIAVWLTWLEMSKWNFASEKFPQTQSVAKDIRFDGVACALSEDLRSHPAEVLCVEKQPQVMYSPCVQFFLCRAVFFLVRTYLLSVFPIFSRDKNVKQH